MLQAFSGILDLTGEKGGAPARSPFSPIDQATGHHAVIGILAALMRKMQTGEGGLVEVSLYESAMQFVSYLLQAYWATGQVPTKVGCEHPSLVPYQPFQTSDGVILIGIANDSLWQKFCRAFDLMDHVDDRRFRTNPDRVLHRAETVALVQQAVGNWEAEVLLSRLIEIGIPCAPINTIGDFAAHPQTAALGIVAEYNHPQIGVLQAVVQPVQFDRNPRTAGTAPPMLGQHNREILAMLGMDNEQIDAAFSSGALGDQDPIDVR